MVGIMKKRIGGGGGMPVYIGIRRRQIGSGNVYSGSVRRQQGGTIFGFLRRMLVPLAKRLFTTVKPHLKTIGMKVGKEAVRVGTHAVGDLMSGNMREIPKTVKRETKRGINNLAEDYIGQKVFTNNNKNTTTSQEGSGRGRKRKAIPARHRTPSPIKRRRISTKGKKKRRTKLKNKAQAKRRITSTRKKRRTSAAQRRKTSSLRDIFNK